MSFAVEMASYLKKYSDNVDCWARVGGATGEIAWMLQLPDMAAVEKFNEQLLGDADYWKRVDEAREAGLFDQASFQDGLWRRLG
ncbi:MAG: hypothetical protein QNK04_22020 [Myxococcota bacterium]|nr:hypothetical protein [Myxococcota bacterium]